jgi:RsiW-degrading membrane proteinase PrsW (M82 family)
MTSVVRESHDQPASTNDLRLAVIAGTGVTLAIVALVARLAGLLGTGPATLIVLFGATVGLKVAFSYAAKSASAPSRACILERVSTVGLAISGLTMLAALPHLTKKAGFGTFTADLVAALWTLTVLAVAAGRVRTLGWRAFVGAGLTGFLAVPAIAALVGRPVVTALGTSSLLAVSAWVPVTEELCKLIPVAFVAVVALRRTAVRPSALDLMLLGAWTGAGFALYENAIYGRGGFDLNTVPVVSLLFPVETATSVGTNMVHGGHLIGSALIALGIGLAVLYRERIPRPRLVLLAAFLAPLIEHALANDLVATRESGFFAELGLAVSFGGLLSSVLLMVGVGYAAWMERRAIGITGFQVTELRPEEWLRLSPVEAQRRSRLLARAQQQVRRSTLSIQESRV